MTQAIDPFAQSDGSVSVNPNAAPAEDPFAQPSGGGDFPKLNELFGMLLLISPKLIEEVPDKFSSVVPAPMVKRLTADTTVLTGLRAGETFEAMYWSQKPIVSAARSAMDKGVPAILGTLRRVPIGQDKKENKYPTLEAFEAALEAWRPAMGAPIRFAWILDKFTEGDAQIAREFLAKKK
jgi:hypothetical protein